MPVGIQVHKGVEGLSRQRDAAGRAGLRVAARGIAPRFQLPGEENVTDGSVDWYEMDWENVDNGVLESEMPKCPETPCSAASRCEDNTPEQTDDETYEVVEE